MSYTINQMYLIKNKVGFLLLAHCIRKKQYCNTDMHILRPQELFIDSRLHKTVIGLHRVYLHEDLHGFVRGRGQWLEGCGQCC